MRNNTVVRCTYCEEEKHNARGCPTKVVCLFLKLSFLLLQLVCILLIYVQLEIGPTSAKQRPKRGLGFEPFQSQIRSKEDWD